jgi:hypothetical protein
VEADALEIVVDGRKEPALWPLQAGHYVIFAEVVYLGGGFAAGVLHVEGDPKIVAKQKRDDQEKAIEQKIERGNEGEQGLLVGTADLELTAVEDRREVVPSGSAGDARKT